MKDLIGFFDSGVGGISVLHAAHQLMPNENFLYYGDNGNAPYGPRPIEEIQRLTANGIQFLLDRGVKAIVVACNTATSAYIDILRQTLDIPVIGIEPALKPAQEARHGGKIIALATKATLSLPKFKRLMQEYGDNVIPVVGEGLVEMVESGMARSPQAEETIQALLAPYRDQQIDAIVLGCTHYPFMESSFKKLFPQSALFDGRFGTAQQLRNLLARNNLLSDDTPGRIEYHTSGDKDTLELMQKLLLSLDEFSKPVVCAKGV